MNYDTFFTHHYKGACCIYQKVDRTTNQFIYEWQDDCHNVRPAKSWRAAQLAITKYLKEKTL